MKSDLELTNKKLRDSNYELSCKNKEKILIVLNLII